MIEAILNNGVDLILYLQSLGEWIFAPMRAFTFLGTENFYLLILPILYWAIDARLGARVGVILLLSGSVNTLLKWGFHLPRPFWYDARVQGMVVETSFGAPSGHAQISMSIWGLIAATLRRRWAWVAALTVVFFIGLSRLVLGVHFHLDVLLGWLIGAILLWLFLHLEEPVTSWVRRRGLGAQIGTVFVLSLGIILVGALTLAGLDEFELPAAWVQNALADLPAIGEFNPLDLNGLITSTAALFGLASGLIWMDKRGGFDVGGVWWRRGVRVLMGLVGVLLLWQGLGAILPRDPNLLGYSLRFARYSLVGLWVAALAPMTFVRLGLAEAKEA